MSAGETVDVLVVGAGPAGMAAAVMAAASGASTVLLDENAGPGGQIYRSIASPPIRRRGLLGGAYWLGENWIQRLNRSKAAYRPSTTVWTIGPDGDEIAAGIVDADGARMIRARQAVIATGAMERPFVVPGWTLPGAMTVGAAQTMLKSSALVPEGNVVLAGSGPLLYLFARQMVSAGSPPSLILDTTPGANWRRAAWHLPAFVASRYFFAGIGLKVAVRRRVEVVRGVDGLRIEGSARVEEIFWRTREGEFRRKADLVLLHQGVVPATNLWSAAGVQAVWNDTQACWHAETDAWGQSSVGGILLAGDGVDIAGAEIATMRGVLAGLQAAHLCGHIDVGTRDQQARPAQIALSRFLRGRDFLDTLFRPADWARLPSGGTIVCRCEEVSADRILAAAEFCAGPNQLKAHLRCGMGPCHGRQCGLAVTELLAQARGKSPAEIGHFRIRPPVKPVTLGDLAELPASTEERASVIRI